MIESVQESFLGHEPFRMRQRATDLAIATQRRRGLAFLPFSDDAHFVGQPEAEVYVVDSRTVRMAGVLVHHGCEGVVAQEVHAEVTTPSPRSLAGVVEALRQRSVLAAKLLPEPRATVDFVPVAAVTGEQTTVEEQQAWATAPAEQIANH